MPISEEEFEEKLEFLLPKKLKELGYISSTEELLTRSDFKLFVEDQNKRWEDQNKRWEEQNKRWEEQNQKWEEQNKRWEDMNKTLQAILLELTELKIGFGTIGRRTGVQFEQMILKLCYELLVENGIEVEKIEKLGIRNSDPLILEGLKKITYDGYLHNGNEILMEIKFHMDVAKIDWFMARARAFEKIRGTKPELWVVAIEIDEFALDRAEEYGIRVITRK